MLTCIFHEVTKDRGETAFVFPVVPFDKIGIDGGDRAEAGNISMGSSRQSFKFSKA